MSTTTDMGKKTLGTMNKEELRAVCKSLEVEFLETDTNKTLEEKIIESGRYASKKENAGGSVTVKDGVKRHKTLGTYKSVKVHPTGEHNKNTSIFVSIGLYTVEFHPNETVSLPTEVIKYIKTLGEPEYYYDPKFVTENGNVGAHKTRYKAKYIVEVVDEELED